HPASWQVWADAPRMVTLIRNSTLLVTGTLALALPAGTAAALVLERSDLPLRRALRALLPLALFVPLPLVASAWQAALGSDGWLALPVWRTVAPDDPDLAPTGIAWKPWARGLPAAVWVHACAAIPWVAWLVGLGLRAVERSAEEDALLAGGPWAALRS